MSPSISCSPFAAPPIRVALIALALLAALCAAPAAAQDRPVDLPAYEQLLREAQTAATRGDRISLDAVAPRLAGITGVRLPDGSVAPADNAWLADELARPFPRLELIAARLGALVDGLAAPPLSAPADAEARLEAILARPPFADPSDAPREPGWLERFLDWLGDLLGDVAAPVGEAASGTPGTLASWALFGAGTLLVVAVLIVWLRGLGQTLRPTATLPPPAAVEARDEADARAKAAQLARAGDYRGAVRLLALAALLWLDEGGQLRYDAHQTNREHLARLRDKPRLQRILAPVVDTADRVWYGGAPMDDGSYAAYARQVDELRERQADAT